MTSPDDRPDQARETPDPDADRVPDPPATNGPATTGPATSPAASSVGPPATPRPNLVRLLVVVFGVLLLQAGFITSYAGALHDAEPHRVPAAVVAPQALVDRLNTSLAAAGGQVHAVARPDAASARSAIVNRTVDAAYVPGPNSTATLLVASGRSPATVQLMTQVFTVVAQKTHAKLTVRDIAPVSAGDPRELTSFYLVIGWTVGGYLLATVLGLFGGMAPVSPRAAASRIAIFAGYAVASGVSGALIVEEGYGYLSGEFVPLAAAGALIVFAVGAFTSGLQSLFGLVGTFLTIGLFVVLGNPSAGGPWPEDMLSNPWRSFGPWLPNGAGLTTVRQLLYFDSHAVGGPIGVLAGFAALGVATMIVLSRRGRPLIDLAGGTT